MEKKRREEEEEGWELGCARAFTYMSDKIKLDVCAKEQTGTKMRLQEPEEKRDENER